MSWLYALQSKLPFAGPPDGRSPSQIEDDLDDEFAFHLEMKARELVTEGHDPDVARGFALKSFGDISRLKHQCKRIALEERIMLQRVNFVMMIVVLLMVVGVGIQVFITQRYNTLALQDITAQLAKMRMDAAAEARERGSNATSDEQVTSPAVGKWIQVNAADEIIDQGLTFEVISPTDIRYRSRPGGHRERPRGLLVLNDRELWLDFYLPFQLSVFEDGRSTVVSRWVWVGETLVLRLGDVMPEITEPVRFKHVGGEPAEEADRAKRPGFLYIDGDFGRPGVYAYPEHGTLTLRRALTASGFNLDENALITIIGLDGNRRRGANVTTKDLRADAARDHELRPGDIIRIEALDADGKQFAPTDRARADALAQFVQQLFLAANPHDDTPNATVRELLDRASAEIEQKYANDPQTQAMLRELIQARRTILEADEPVATRPD